MRKGKSFARRETFGLAAAGALFVAGGARAEDDAPPKGPKIAPPPADAGKAEDVLMASQMIGLKLRVVRPGQMVTQEYNAGRLTVTVDKNEMITEIRIG